ncbi:hypothetical protein INT45_007932 [Circinella minor]|uniref:Uncharacterized protein n=1 Tax=Circinella minor TaxID=1195481 RepID=A0A8H7S8E6_9FUNG|nr:hypothetical protein INT45_007932 [Circinella minor]
MMVVMLSLLLTVHQEVVSAASQSPKSKRLLGIRPECLSLRLNPLNRSCCQSYQIDPCNPLPSCGAQTLSERQRYLECCAPNGIQSALGCL